jgi:hypothetical protein
LLPGYRSRPRPRSQHTSDRPLEAWPLHHRARKSSRRQSCLADWDPQILLVRSARLRRGRPPTPPVRLDKIVPRSAVS